MHPVHELLSRRASVRTEAMAARARQHQHAKTLATWLQADGVRVNAGTFVRQFTEVSKQSHDAALLLCVRNLAHIDGYVRANETLRTGLKMPAAGLDIAELTAIQNKITVLQATNLMLVASGLGADTCNQVMARTLAREWPMKDGTRIEPTVGTPNAAPAALGWQDQAPRTRAEPNKPRAARATGAHISASPWGTPRA